MSLSRRARLSALLSLVLGLTGWFPFPVPVSVQERLMADLGLELAGERIDAEVDELRFRWGTGSLMIRGLEATTASRQLIYADRADLRLDLRPWSSSFLQPRAADLEGITLGLNPDDLQQLRQRRDGAAFEIQPVALRLRGIRAEMPFPDGRVLSAELPEAEGLLSHQRTRIRGTAVTPYGLSAGFRFAAGAGYAGWTLDLECDDRDLRDRGHLPVPVSAASCVLRARLSSDDASARVAVEGLRIQIPNPPVEVVLPSVRLEGRLSTGMRLSLEAASGPVELQLGGWLKRSGPEELTLRLEGGSTGPWQVDEELIAWIDTLDATTADAFQALELRGDVPARLAVDWRSGAWPEAIAHAPFEDFRATYRGFLEDDGDRPSFPYPAEGMRGDFVAAGQRFLMHANGRAGDGSIGGWGTVFVHRGPAEVMVDLAGTALPVDSRVTRAASGTPVISQVWRELGGPRGGSADFELFLRREAGHLDVGIQLDAQASGTVVRPAFLPVEAEAEQVAVRWTPGSASFEGSAKTMGGRVSIRGEIRELAGDATPAVEVRAESLEGLAPNTSERRVLESFLQLPEGFAEFELKGRAAVDGSFRRNGAGELQALLGWSGEGAGLRWLPTGTGWSALRGDAAIARSGDATLVSVPLMQSGCCGGALELSGFLTYGVDGAPPSSALVHGLGVGVEAETEAFARELSGLGADARKDWSGAFDLALEVDPLAPERNRGWLRLRPLRAAERTADGGERELELEGLLQVADTRFVGGTLDVRSSSGDFQMREITVDRGEAGTLVGARLDSDGIELGEDFAELLSPGAWAAFDRVGLTGRAQAEDLQLRLMLDGGEADFTLSGGLKLEQMRVEGPPRMRGGSGRLQIDGFHWAGPEDYFGRLRLQEGRADVAGFALRDAQGWITLNQDRVAFQAFEADLLGGTVRTFGTDEQDQPEQGELVFGLTREAPISFLLFLEDISLARVREELAFGGDLAGRVRGRLQFESSSPSPIDYTGRGWLEVEQGVLGTVPVLSRMWRVAGVEPPIFDRGRIEFRANAANSRGRLRVDKFELHHDLLEVRGKGWIGLDSYLNLKATVRTLSFLTRLPLVRDVVDLLIEQDVFGPMDRPRIRQRALGKVADPLPERLAFPLWVPALELTDWRRSPAFPAVSEPRGQDQD